MPINLTKKQARTLGFPRFLRKTEQKNEKIFYSFHCEKLSTWTPKFWREYRGFGSPFGFWSSNLVVINRYLQMHFLLIWYLLTVLILCSSHVVCVEKPRLMYLYIKLRISTHLVEFWKGTHKVGTQFIILVAAPSNMEFYP